MKLLLKNSLLALVLSIGAIPAFAHDNATLDTMTTPHNGQLRMVGAYHLELVVAKDNKTAKESPVDVYLTDHAGNAQSAQGVTATATILTGKKKVVVPLVAVADNQLSGKASYAYNAKTKVVVSISFTDKTVAQALFTPNTAKAAHHDHGGEHHHH